MGKRESAGGSDLSRSGASWATRRSRLLKDLQELLDEVAVDRDRNAVLQQLNDEIAQATLSPQRVLNFIVDKCIQMTGSQHGQVVELRRGHLLVTACSDRSRIGTELPTQGSLCGLVFRTGKPRYVRDVTGFKPYVRFNPETRSELALPVRRPGHSGLLAILNIERNITGPFDDSALAFADLLAGHVALALQEARLWRAIADLQRLGADILAGRVELSRSHERLLESVQDSLGYTNAQLLGYEGDAFRILASSHPSDVGLRVGATNSVVGKYLLEEGERQLLAIGDLPRSRYRRTYLPLMNGGHSGMRSEVIVPLLERDLLIGALNVESPRRYAYSSFDQELLELIAAPLGHALAVTYEVSTQASRERMARAKASLTALGYVADSALHEHGNALGDLHGNVAHVRSLLEKAGTRTIEGHDVVHLLSQVEEGLAEVGVGIGQLVDGVNPSQARFDSKDLDLAVVAEAAVERARSTWSRESITFSYRSALAEGPAEVRPSVSGRPLVHLTDQFGGVLDDLIDNAVRAVLLAKRQGTVLLEVDLPDPLHARLRITDNGIGIAPDKLAEVLQLGYTTKDRPGASGLGLWLAMLYVEQRGGRIVPISKQGEWTTMELVFPLSGTATWLEAP